MRIDIKIVLFVFILALFSCRENTVEKPEILVREDQMIDLLVDIHLAEATFNTRRHRDSMLLKSNSAEFYYSVLKKHEVPDSVFEQSFVYYASQPRKFEKMYRQAMNKLNEMEQEFSGRNAEQQELELDIEKRRQ